MRLRSAFRLPGCSLGILYAALLTLGSAGAVFSQSRPDFTIEEECVAMDFAPDGRLAYAVRRIITVRRIDMQRDDIWVVTPDGEKKRIVNGEKLIQGRVPFSYAIQSLRWSPDGRSLTVEMFTSVFTDFERGETEESFLTLLINDQGKEIKIRGADSVIPEGGDATWLADGATVVYLTEAVKPKLLFSVQKVRPAAGRGAAIFPQSTFVSVAWDAPRNRAVAIERDSGLRTPPQLVLLDLLRETRRDLLTLDGFLGKLTVSPSGKKVAYFRDQDTLEIRSLEQPSQVATVRIAYGDYVWTPDETRLLVKRGVERKNSNLFWVHLPEPGATETASRQALHGLTFRAFAIAPDGSRLAVIEPGKRNLQLFPLQ